MKLDITKVGEWPALIVSVIGSLFLSWLFLKAIINPAAHADFILRIGILIFVIEFLTIHSSAMLAGSRDEAQQKGWRAPRNIFFICLYSIFALSIGFGLQNWVLPGVFFISLLTKVLGNKAHDHNKKQVLYPVLLLMGCQMLSLFFAYWIQSLWPLPLDIYDSIMASSSGMETRPLFFIVWGVFYYFFFAVVDVILFFWKKPEEAA